MSRAIIPATQRPRCRLSGSTSMMVVVGIVVALAGMLPEQAAAAGDGMSAAKVLPATGTTETRFVFSVAFIGRDGLRANRVVAQVANRTVDLGLFSGRADDGVWEAAARLPAGSWPVTFEATAAEGSISSLAGPTVVVSAVPAFVAAPPALRSTSRGSSPSSGSVAATGLRLASTDIAPQAGLLAEPSGKTPSHPAAEETSRGDLPWTLALVVSLGIVALVGGMRLFAVVGRRQHRFRARAGAPAPSRASPRGAIARRTRLLARWEPASLDDEPIGTVEYTGPAAST